jgi:hypothetical protein
MAGDWLNTLRSYCSNVLLFFSCVIVLIGVCKCACASRAVSLRDCE